MTPAARVRSAFAAIVRDARKRAGLSQVEVARRLGLRQWNGNTVSLAECGKLPTPRIEDLRAWAHALDAPVSLLVGAIYEEPKDRSP